MRKAKERKGAISMLYNAHERSEIYRQAIEVWGEDMQLTVAIEEMAELTKEICKLRRGESNKAAIAEELADVTICLEQLQQIVGIIYAVPAFMDDKLERLKDRINKFRKRQEITDLWHE